MNVSREERVKRRNRVNASLNSPTSPTSPPSHLCVPANIFRVAVHFVSCLHFFFLMLYKSLYIGFLPWFTVFWWSWQRVIWLCSCKGRSRWWTLPFISGPFLARLGSSQQIWKSRTEISCTCNSNEQLEIMILVSKRLSDQHSILKNRPMHTQQHQSRISWLPLHASKMHVLMGRWVVSFQLKSLRFRFSDGPPCLVLSKCYSSKLKYF